MISKCGRLGLMQEVLKSCWKQSSVSSITAGRTANWTKMCLSSLYSSSPPSSTPLLLLLVWFFYSCNILCDSIRSPHSKTVLNFWSTGAFLWCFFPPCVLTYFHSPVIPLSGWWQTVIYPEREGWVVKAWQLDLIGSLDLLWRSSESWKVTATRVTKP